VGDSLAIETILYAYMSPRRREALQQDGMKKVLEQMRARIDRFCEDELGEGPNASPLVSDDPDQPRPGAGGAELPRLIESRVFAARQRSRQCWRD